MKIQNILGLSLAIIGAGSLVTSCGPMSSDQSSVQNSQAAPSAVDFISMVVKELKFSTGRPNQPVTQICYAVFAGPEGYPNDTSRIVSSGCKEVDSTIVSFLVSELPPSENGYAISLFQDLNGNGKLDTRSLFGMQVPDEPYGFTNNPTALRAPTYEEVRITPTKNGDKFEVSMRSI